jgi:hypothetical protein
MMVVVSLHALHESLGAHRVDGAHNASIVHDMKCRLRDETFDVLLAFRARVLVLHLSRDDAQAIRTYSG